MGRFGGEESAVLLAGVDDESEARLAAERLRTRVAVNVVPVHLHPVVQVTVSVGLVVSNSPVLSLPEPLAAADLALHRSKDAGRNQTGVA